MNEFIEQFLVESRELVQQATDDLLALERAPEDRARLDSAFRAFHTLKGGAGIVGFAAMERALHGAESVLSAARSGTRRIGTAGTGDCLACLDQIVAWLDAMQETGELPGNADAGAAAIAERFARPSQPASDTAAREILEAQVALLSGHGVRGAAGRLASAGVVAANVLRHLGRPADAERLAGVAARSLAGNAPDLLREEIGAVLKEGDAPAAAAPAPRAGQDSAAQTLRVDAARIDALVSLTGELTVAKNAIGHAVKLAQAQGGALAVTLKNRHALLDRLVGELQRAVLGMRVVPLRSALQRFPRLVREMAAELRKPAILVIEGEETEADRAIVEILSEPLLHVLRNAMDHGIENAAARAAAGKPEEATILLRAARQGEHVVLEIADDGRGIDVARVREVARERGVVPDETLSSMSDEQLIDLIFAPGFSTAIEVTGLSGRGVGMDAVRSAVRRLGGQVEVKSAAGKGTTVRFVLPFSVMITPIMTVEAGGQVFGLPLDAVVETVRLPRDRIAPVGAAHAIVLRERTLPLLDLGRVLDVKCDDRAGDATVVIVRIDGELGALQVDRLGERMEIMLKPLEGLLSGMQGIAGTTLLGDGSVLLVLDLAELLQ